MLGSMTADLGTADLGTADLGGADLGSADLGIAVIHYRTPEVALDCLARLRIAAPDARKVLVDTAPEPSFQARLAEEFPEVTFLPVANHSYSRSVNAGLATLDTPYLVQMNADVLVEEGTLTGLREALDANPASGAVAPLALTTAGVPQPMGLPYQRHYTALERAAAAPRSAGAPPPSVQVEWLAGCMQLFTREAWEASGGYDETFRFFNEDLDFCLRLGKRGYDLRLVATPVLHLGGTSTPSHPAFHVEGRRGGMEVSRRHRSRTFQAAHLAFLWAEALSGRLLAKEPEKRAAHAEMLRLLRSGAWHESPFGETLDERRDLLSELAVGTT